MLSAEEHDPATPDGWRLTAYVEEVPSPALLARLVELADGGDAAVERLVEADWVSLSQRGLEPVRAGRFLVHTPEHRAARRPGDIALEIGAGLAFGTGQHATTLGCLQALDGLAWRRPFRAIADLGTGTGVLAFAALRRWPQAAAIGSDIDPVAVAVARSNARRNAVRLGRGAGRLELITAGGLAHRQLRGPRFDLVLANILARPLIELAGDIAAALAPRGVVVLAGLLGSQRGRVLAAYRARGLRPLAQHGTAEWPVLVLRGPVRGAMRGTAPTRPPER